MFIMYVFLLLLFCLFIFGLTQKVKGDHEGRLLPSYGGMVMCGIDAKQPLLADCNSRPSGVEYRVICCSEREKQKTASVLIFVKRGGGKIHYW